MGFIIKEKKKVEKGPWENTGRIKGKDENV